MNAKFLVFVLVTILPLACLTPTNTTVEVSRFHSVVNVFTRHTELKKWFGRLGERFESQAQPEVQDIDGIRNWFNDQKLMFHDYVTSSRFDKDVKRFAESVIEFTSPLVALLPSEELKKLQGIVVGDPELMQYAYQLQMLIL